MLKVKSGGLADNFGLCDGDQVLQVGRMKVDPRDGLNLGNVEMLLRMPTPQLEIVVFRLVDCLLNLNKIILSLQIVSAVSFLIFFCRQVIKDYILLIILFALQIEIFH